MNARFSIVSLLLSLLALAFVGCGGDKGDVKITAVDPQVGALQGEQPIKIKGANFRTDIGYTVYFGNKKSNQVTIMDSETLVASSPQRDEPGTVDITLAADNGPAWKIKQAFKYKDMGGSVVEKIGEGQEKGKLKY